MSERKMQISNIPEDLINKMIMMSVPTYPYMEELKTTRFIRIGCDCEGCTEKQYYGCYFYRDFNYRLKPTEAIMTLFMTME